MGLVIPFITENYNPLLEDSDESHILSQKHKILLKKKLTFLTKIITDKDLKLIRAGIPKKLESVRGSKAFVARMQYRINLLYQFLFDPDFSRSRTTEKTIAAGLLYFLRPGDLISDNTPGLGYLDDAYIIGTVWEKVHDEIMNYTALKI